ncbi:MAG: spore coat associated protein CotJA [Faecalibacillus sp.]
MNNLELAISSIRMQEFEDIYPIHEAFCRGTIFRQLDKPWVMCRG